MLSLLLWSQPWPSLAAVPARALPLTFRRPPTCGRGRSCKLGRAALDGQGGFPQRRHPPSPPGHLLGHHRDSPAGHAQPLLPCYDPCQGTAEDLAPEGRLPVRPLSSSWPDPPRPQGLGQQQGWSWATQRRAGLCPSQGRLLDATGSTQQRVWPLQGAFECHILHKVEGQEEGDGPCPQGFPVLQSLLNQVLGRETW